MAQEVEAVLILKTKKRPVRALIAEVKKLHSYSVPCIVEWRIGNASPSYSEWIMSEIRDLPVKRLPKKRCRGRRGRISS
ncbi:MAG: divalent-cation tolerance protein CutA [Alphaproteobacteria bacterium]|nr:divalent-cation tolerance protein CutA [Alphaproteobacteria bacterium]